MCRAARTRIEHRDPLHHGDQGMILGVAAALVPAVQAQFQFFAVPDNSEKPVTTVYDLGKVPPAVAVQARFRLRNVSSRN